MSRIFFSSFLVPNYRIIEFCLHTEYRGRSRIFLFFFLSRIIEFCLHTEYRGQSRIFFSSFLVPNFRIFEFLSSHGISRTVTDFLFFFSCPELSNYRIFVFTRNIADSHGFLSCPEFSNYIFLVPRLVLGPTDQREVIIEFLSSVILRDIPCDYKKIRKFANSQIRDREKVS